MLLRNKIFIVILFSVVLIGVIEFFHFTSIVCKVCRYQDYMIATSIALRLYANDYKTLPPKDQWCDKLTEDVDCSPSMFQSVYDSKEGVCGLALNAKLDGLIFSELDDDIVLVFEAKGPWNLSGGPELIDKEQKKISVAFAGGYMEFIKPEDIDELRWEP